MDLIAAIFFATPLNNVLENEKINLNEPKNMKFKNLKRSTNALLYYLKAITTFFFKKFK